MKRDRASDLRAIADGRLMLNVRNGVTVPSSMLAMIADEIDALRAAPPTPAEVGGLVERLRGTHTCDGCGEYAGSQIADLTEEAATALEALSAALASERAAHAETKRELSALEDHPRATNTVDAHEAANVSDKPEGQQPVAYRVHAPEDDYYGTGPDSLQFHPLAQYDMDNGYRQTPLYERPAVELSGNAGELIDKMAEAIRGDTTSDDTPWATLSEDRKIGWRGDAERALAVVKEYLTAHAATALRLSAGEVWRPIESAPHGVNVLLAYWDEVLGGWHMEAGMASWGWRRGGVSNMSAHGQATHWQPLPLPPASPTVEVGHVE